MGIPDSVFSKGLDGLAGRYLKHTRPINERAMKRALTAEALRVAEAVLLSPKVTFKVYGENVVAPLLANFFGVTGVRRLLDDRAIDFILWDQVITSMNEPIPGMLPLAPGTLNTPPHAIPMESAKTGINGWGKGIPRKERKALARSVAKRTRTLPKGIAEATSHRVMELGANGGLRKIGIEGGDDWGVDARRHAKIRDFAASLMESAILTQRKTDLLNADDVWDSMVISSATIRTHSGLHKTAAKILEYEGLPDVPSLLLSQAITFDDILELRNRPETVEFRRWLWSDGRSDDYGKACDDYYGLLARQARVDPGHQIAKKAVRISTLSVAGGLSGAAIAGPVGGAVGLAVGTAVGAGISLIDGLLLNRFLEGDNPRRLATDLLRPRATLTND